MADIKQAGKWMQQGRSVRRKKWPPERMFFIPSEMSNGLIADRQDRINYPVAIRPADLLADDWQIAE